MKKVSWKAAQDVCGEADDHLWTINSHEEFENVFTKEWSNLLDDFLESSSKIAGGIFDPLVSQHFFIGLIQPMGVKKVKTDYDPKFKSHLVAENTSMLTH